ncbi:MAG: imidazole glycerol phosphate synthase subunit HisH [candidate division NC10 bacterium]|nr:imidazole glycerol phosphate synthase subunit HisH [candidate division NC10 bacterium]
MIAIVNSGVANVRSVQKGFERMGFPASVVEEPTDLKAASALVLPGVGAFQGGMDSLGRRGFLEPLRRWIESGKPLLGICLGFQLLCGESEEFGLHQGLNLFPGRVKRFPGGLKVPHMGWNSIRIEREIPLLQGIPQGSYFYFVHSYYLDGTDPSLVAATTEYGISFPSVVGRGAIYATQFHPEKSQSWGLRILKNFGELIR